MWAAQGLSPSRCLAYTSKFEAWPILGFMARGAGGLGVGLCRPGLLEAGIWAELIGGAKSQTTWVPQV